MVSPQHDDADGKVWTNNQDTHLVYRVDVASGKYEDLGQAVDKNGTHINAYGMPTDAQNDAYQLNFGGTTIGRIDAKTKEVTIWKTPLPFSRPRRGRVDADNILWFAEYGANGIGRFDPKTGAIKEWQLPTPWDEPYDVVKAKDGEIWTGSMLTDRVARLDPKTDSITEYQLPRSTNIRRVFVDDRGRGRCSGSAAITAPRSSRSSRWIRSGVAHSGRAGARTPASPESITTPGTWIPRSTLRVDSGMTRLMRCAEIRHDRCQSASSRPAAKDDADAAQLRRRLCRQLHLSGAVRPVRRAGHRQLRHRRRRVGPP